MQYGFYINQKAILDLSNKIGIKLDAKDAMIIDFLKNFAGSGEMTVHILNGKQYWEIWYSKLISELPLIEIDNKRVMARRLDKLTQAKILDKQIINNNTPVFCWGNNYKAIIKPLEEVNVEQPQTQDVGGSTPEYKGVYSKVQGGSTPEYTNHYTNNHYSSSIKNPHPDFVENWKPNSMYQQTVQMACPDMDDQDFTVELNQFKLHYTTESPWPKNADKSWLSWCQRSNPNYRERKLRQARIDESDRLAQDRISEFHLKKKANISKVGTSKFVKKEVVQPDPLDYNSAEEFFADCDKMRAEGKIVEPRPITVTTERIWDERRADPPPSNDHIAKLREKMTAKYN